MWYETRSSHSQVTELLLRFRLSTQEGRLALHATSPKRNMVELLCCTPAASDAGGWLTGERCGIQAGDILLRVDDVEVLGRDPVQVRSLLRGAPDTKVVLRFLRKEMGETRGESG